jgi:hypothetical protein
VPPEQWARAYRDLQSLEKMGWREWDVNPLRAQAAWKEKSAENRRAYEENVPLPRCWHATAVLGNKVRRFLSRSSFFVCLCDLKTGFLGSGGH